MLSKLLHRLEIEIDKLILIEKSIEHKCVIVQQHCVYYTVRHRYTVNKK